MASEVTTLIFDLIAKDNASKTLLKSAAQVGAVGLAVAKFAGDSVKAYAEAEQAQAKLAYAYTKFPKLADATIGSMKDLNTELAKKTIYDDDATAAAEASLAQYKLTGQQIQKLIPLVQDYARATGQDVVAAADNIGRAFLGNARALKTIGINFKATGDTAKDFATIQAALNEKVGGFAEQQGKTAADQAKILTNQFGELQETVGAALVPTLNTLVSAGTHVLELFNALPAPVQQTAVILGGISAVALVAVPKIAAMKVALLELGLASKGAAAGLTAEAGAAATAGNASAGAAGKVAALGKAAGVVGIALAVAAAATDAFRTAVGDTVRDGDAAAKTLLDIGKAGAITKDQLHDLGSTGYELRDLIGNVFDRRPIDNFNAGVKQLSSLGGILPWGDDDVDAAKTAFASIDAGLTSLVGSGRLAEAKQAFDVLAQAAKDQGVSVEELSKEFPGYTAAMTAAEGGLAGLTDEQANAKVAADEMADAAKAEAQAFDDLVKSVTSFNDPFIDLAEAQIALRDDTRDMVAALKESHGALDTGTKKADEAKSKVLEFAQGVDKVAAAMLAEGKPHKDIIALYDQQRVALEKTLIKMGVSRATAAAYAAELLQIPADVRTELSVAVTAKIVGVTLTASAARQAQGIATSKKLAYADTRATGGPVQAGTAYLVGEKGAEVVTFPRDGYVHPNTSGGAAPSYGSSQGQVMQVEIHTHTTIGDRDIVEVVRRAVRTRGGDVVKVLG